MALFYRRTGGIAIYGLLGNFSGLIWIWYPPEHSLDTMSRPYVKPESGKIAMKVINHFVDKVLKVIEI
jgi:hypothetical protein